MVKAGARYRSEQGSAYDPGVNAETDRVQGSLPGCGHATTGRANSAHVHERHETALYVVSGEIEIWTGDQLQHRETASPGDYIYIPANVLHVVVNRGNQPAVCIGTRNEPTAQESLVLYPEMDARVS